LLTSLICHSYEVCAYVAAGVSFACDKAGQDTASTVAGSVAAVAGGAKVGASCYRRYCRPPAQPPQGPQGQQGQQGYVLGWHEVQE